MHIIRLREPWEREADGDLVRCRRWFNKPTGLEGGTKVYLAIDGLASGAVITLNDEALPSPPEARWDITSHLQARNSLVIAADSDSPFGEVRLEINE